MASSIFSPPRTKPKISIQQPTLAVGQPYVPPQVINRPVNLVDDEGNIHGRIGENPNGPEMVSIKPPPGPTNDPAGGPFYASGGNLLIGNNWNNPDQESSPVIGTGLPSLWTETPSWYNNTGPTNGGPTPPPSYNPYPATIGTGIFSPPTPSSTPPVIIGGINPNNPNAQINNTQQHQIETSNAALDMKARVLDARGQALGANRGVQQANQNVLNLRGINNNMQRGVIQQEGANTQQRLQELQGIYRASQNTPDLMNVADATNQRNAENRRSSQAGVAPAAEVNLPPGYNGPRIAGINPKIMSQEERLTEKAGYEDPIRQQQLELAKNAVDLQSTDVTAARLAAEQAGMTLDEANNMVKRAELDADYSSIINQRASLEEEQAKQPPFAGAQLYTNPQTGEGQWVTPWKAALLKRDDEKRLSSLPIANKYSDSPHWGAFSTTELESFFINKTMTEQEFRNELTKRGGLTPEQVEIEVQDTKKRASKGGGLGEVGSITGSGVQTGPQQVPVTPKTTPGAAPSGTNSSSGVELPPYLR